MGNAIESVGQITPEWLTAVLRERGTLARGRVESVRPGTFMMATEWEPETRRRLEQGLLRRTYGRLLAHGVRDYQSTWDSVERPSNAARNVTPRVGIPALSHQALCRLLEGGPVDAGLEVPSPKPRVRLVPVRVQADKLPAIGTVGLENGLQPDDDSPISVL